MTDMITLRNEGKNHLIVEINGKEVIREFYASGESEVNHTYHWHDRPQPCGDAVDGYTPEQTHAANILAAEIAMEWREGVDAGQVLIGLVKNGMATLTQPSICKDGLPKLTQENPYVTQPKADVDTLMKDVYAAYENDDDSHKKSTVAWVIDHLAAQGYVGGGDGWQPIETAPRDGTKFLAYISDWYRNRNLYVVIHYSKGEYFEMLDGFQTFDVEDILGWQPLPAAPKKEEKHE